MGLAAYSPGDTIIPTAQQPGETPIAIDTAQSLGTIPTTPTGASTLVCTIVIERADSTATGCRYLYSGTTPTASVGLLLPAATSTAPVTLVLRGRDIITNFQIIGTGAGNFMTYEFSAQKYDG